MCSNFTPPRPNKITQHFGLTTPDFAYKTEIYPAYMSPIIRRTTMEDDTEDKECVLACFGMVPHWADFKLARHTYNARTETVGQKPSFRHAYRNRQFCIIPAENFYEPCYESGKAVRWKISHIENEPLGIAGIWEFRSNGPDGQPLVSFSMLTINADDHPLMSKMHKPNEEKRMPVILKPAEYDNWIHASVEETFSFFTPFPAVQLQAKPAPRQKDQY